MHIEQFTANCVILKKEKVFQDILVFITITGAIAYLIYGVVKANRTKHNHKKSGCEGCISNSCKIKSYKDEVTKQCIS